MRKINFLLVLVFFYCNGSSQTLNYSIVYGTEFSDQSNLATAKSEYRLTSRLVFNDTFSFYYHSKSSKNLREDQIDGKKFFHHSYHTKAAQGLRASGVSFRLKKPVWVMDIRQRSWTPYHETKTILGYQCLSAVSVDSAQNVVLAYYTTKLPAQFGPEGYLGLPGTILEVFHPKFNRHIVATNITEGQFLLKLPERIPVLTAAEYDKIRPPAIQPTITIRKF